MSRVYTQGRPWGSSSDRTTRISDARTSAPAGRYEVWYRGNLIAECTDLYMAKAVMAAVEDRERANGKEQ